MRTSLTSLKVPFLQTSLKVPFLRTSLKVQLLNRFSGLYKISLASLQCRITFKCRRYGEKHVIYNLSIILIFFIILPVIARCINFGTDVYFYWNFHFPLICFALGTKKSSSQDLKGAETFFTSPSSSDLMHAQDARQCCQIGRVPSQLGGFEFDCAGKYWLGRVFGQFGGFQNI